MTPTNLSGLIERLRANTEADNALDIAIALALFKPDATYVSVRPNNAGTKLIYSLASGGEATHWAFDYTLNEDTRNGTMRLLLALQSEVSNV